MKETKDLVIRRCGFMGAGASMLDGIWDGMWDGWWDGAPAHKSRASHRSRSRGQSKIGIAIRIGIFQAKHVKRT